MLYDKILALCKDRGVSVAKVERECGLGNATIRGWIASAPRVDKLKPVADYFGVTVDELISEKN